jgi:uncharacterized protein YjiS (DUF1127 family)
MEIAMPSDAMCHATAAARAGLVARLRPGRLLFALEMHRQRARLSQLDDHLLRDIGLTRAEAAAEACRPVWDAPAHWFD